MTGSFLDQIQRDGNECTDDRFSVRRDNMIMTAAAFLYGGARRPDGWMAEVEELLNEGAQ